jgi:hypothetical protein
VVADPERGRHQGRMKQTDLMASFLGHSRLRLNADAQANWKEWPAPTCVTPRDDAGRSLSVYCWAAVLGVDGWSDDYHPSARAWCAPTTGPSAPTRGQAALIFANLITLAHFSVSSAINSPKASGEPPMADALRSLSRARNFVSSRNALLISLLSLPITSDRVFFGAARPAQKLES